MASSPSRGALLDGRGAPPITAPLLFARRKVPAEAFEKFDRAGSGVVNLEDMRASFSALGVKLSLQEAKALVHRQSASGDKGGSTKSLAFNYRDFLALHGAETGRAEAAKGERNYPEERVDVHNPPPQPSAAHLIIERLQRERAPVSEGWMYSVLSDQPKMKPPPEGGNGEIDRKGGLAAYLADDADADGGAHSRKKAVDTAKRGEFTTTGISEWNQTLGARAAAAQAGAVTSHGHEAFRRQHNDLFFGGQLKEVGGLANLAAEDGPADLATAAERARPKVKTDYSIVQGELQGGLVRYLAESGVDAAAAADPTLLPRLPGQEFARRRELDPMHHGGELLSSGIGGFIGDTSAGATGPSGGAYGAQQRKGFDDTPFSRGSLVVGAAAAAAVAAGRFPLAARSDDEVPVLPADLMMSAAEPVRRRGGVGSGGAGPASGKAGAGAGGARAGPASELDASGGLCNFVSTADPRAGDPLFVRDAETRRVGHISKAGGVGGFLGQSAEEGAGPEGGGAWLRQTQAEAPSSWRGQIDQQGGLGAFLATGATVPEGYIINAATGEVKRRTDLDKAMVGTLDKYGGIAGFFAAAPANAGGVTGDFERQAQDGGLQRVGKIESGGLGAYMMSGLSVPVGYVAPLPGQDDDAPRLIQFANSHRGELDQSGGLNSYLEKGAGGAAGRNFVLYPGDGGRGGVASGAPGGSASANPLHHFAGIAEGGFMGATMGLDPKDGRLYEDDSLAHERSAGPKMKAGRIGMGGDREEPEQAIRRETSLIGLKKERAETLAAHAEEYEREIMRKMDPSGAVSTLSELSPVRVRLHPVGRDKQGFEVGEAAIKRESSLLEVARERRELGRALMEEAEREVMARQEAPPTLAAAPAPAAREPPPSAQPAAAAADSSYSGASLLPGFYPTASAQLHREAQASGSVRHMQASGVTHTGAASPASVAGHSKALGLLSPRGVELVGSRDVAMDLRRLARVRKAIRDVLPKKGGAAVSLLRQRLGKEDGDNDGVISDIELMRGLTVLNPALTSSDVGFIVKYLHSQARHAEEGSAQHADNTGGLAPGIDVAAVADFITRQPGGYGKATEEAAQQQAQAQAQAQLVDDEGRVQWNSRSQNFLTFRASWAEKHGAAAVKELAADKALGADGPTWARADPQAFKVLHLAAAAPSPPASQH